MEGNTGQCVVPVPLCQPQSHHPYANTPPQPSHVIQAHFKSLCYLPHLTTIAAQAASLLAKTWPQFRRLKYFPVWSQSAVLTLLTVNISVVPSPSLLIFCFLGWCTTKTVVSNYLLLVINCQKEQEKPGTVISNPMARCQLSQKILDRIRDVSRLTETAQSPKTQGNCWLWKTNGVPN